MVRSFNLEAVVLKRFNYQEADRFITVFSKEQGKINLLAKGVRKMASKKRSALEVANHVKLHCVKAKSFSLITQAEPLHSFSHAKSNLTRITQIYQILEIIDILTAEEVSHQDIYQHLVNLLYSLEQGGKNKQKILSTIKLVISDLGFGLPTDNSELALRSHLESIVEKNLRSKAFFSPFPQ